MYKLIEHEMECAIELLTKCNYHCEFCSGPRMKKSIKRGYSNEDSSIVIDFFNNSNKTWLIGMSGGEPSIHPHFYKLIDSLKLKHYFYFFTNLTFDVDKFIQTISSDRVQYIKASLHKEANIDEFLMKFDILHQNGYNPILIMVSTPDTFDRVEQVAEISKKRGYNFNLSTLEGPYRGRNYPNDYTREEESIIQKYIEEPGNLIRLFNKTPGGLNTYGCKCKAGSTSFKLDMETGNFHICESDSTILGNIYENTFHPYLNDITCNIINGCVGYDRYIYLPNNYINFFEISDKRLMIKRLKDDILFPKNIDLILDANSEDSSEIKRQAVKMIINELANKKVLFWGAGIHGAKILYSLQQHEKFNSFEFLGFIDSLKDRQKLSILNYPVYSPSNIPLEYDLILVTSHAFEKEICYSADKYNLKVLRLYGDLLKKLSIKSSVF